MDDHNSTARMPTFEPYIDGRKLAAAMGISERTVNRWVAEGMPSETWGLKRTRRFRVSEAIAWARRRAQA